MLDKIDQWISANNEEDEMSKQKLPNWDHPSRTRYWQSIFHHLDSSPLPDTAVVEISKVLCNVVIDDLLKEIVAQGYKFEKLLEVTSYHEDDNLKGILLKFLMKGDSDEETFETLIEPNMKVIQKQAAFRQSKFSVGSGYDPKELIFRNFLYAMNEDSAPMLMASLSQAQEEDDKDFIMKIVMVDPSGDIAYVTEKSVINGTLNKEAYKLELKTPLMAGIWTTMVINQKTNKLILKIPFLIFPTKVDSNHKTVFQSLASQDERKFFSKIFQDSQSEDDLKYKNLNQDRHNLAWPKLLAREFYSLKNSICRSSIRAKPDNLDNLSTDIAPCEETLWSSLSADPKSTITRFDKELSVLL